LFKMARQAAPPTTDLLWLASVSLAGYHDLGLVDEANYDKLACEELNDYLESLGDNGFTQRTEEDEDIAALPSPPRAGARGREDQSLTFERDLRLTLYKHWILKESMMHSAYFYGTLELHRDKGTRALKQLLASAGIQPTEAEQIYNGMQAPTKKGLQKKFSEHGKAQGLNEKMFLQQFIRHRGQAERGQAMNLAEISSVDAANMLTSILATIPPALGNAQTEQLPKTEDGRRDAAKVHEMERQAMVSNFHRASDCVLLRDPLLLGDGIKEAVDVVKAIQNMARFLIDTKALRLSRSQQFRWCKIEQTPNYFRHHLTVRRLAVWLLNVLFRYRPQKGDAGPEKPILLIVRDHIRETYLCVGASPSKNCDQNEFGERFRSVLKTDTFGVRYDFFDKSCIEVAADDFDRFWDTMIETC